MLNTVVIDIETVRDDKINPDLLQSLYDNIEIKADGRIKDQYKIIEDIEEKTLKARQTLESEFALSPLTGKICCIGWKFNTDRNPQHIVSTNEKELLENITNVFSLTDQLTRFITFNGKSFDIPFLKVRSLLNNVSLKFPRNDTKYNLDQHFDVRSALTNFEQYGKGKLEQWCMFFGIKRPVGHTGVDIQTLYDADKLSHIGDICESDVRATSELYERISNAYRY